MTWLCLDAEIASEMREHADHERYVEDWSWLQQQMHTRATVHAEQAERQRERRVTDPAYREERNAYVRQRQARLRAAEGKPRRAYACRVCGGGGHNARTCPKGGPDGVGS